MKSQATEELLVYLRLAGAHRRAAVRGVGALVQARTTGDGVRGSGIRNASCCPEQFALIAAEVQRVTRHPSIVAWYLDRGDALTPTHAALRFKR